MISTARAHYAMASLAALSVFSALLSAAEFQVTSCDYAVVAKAVSDAADGDTLVLPAGTATWTDTITVAKGITIRGAGRTSTVITNNIPGTGSYAQPLFRLEDGGVGVRRVTAIGMRSDFITSAIAKQGMGVWPIGYFTLKRIDHCQFDDLYCGIYVVNANGVSDHNFYYNVGSPTRHVGGGGSYYGGLSGQQYAWNNFRPLAFNSLNYFIHENETIELTGDAQVSDEVEACSYAIRYSTVTAREAHGPYSAAQSFAMFDVHGDNPASRQYSCLSFLLYENDIVLKSGAAMSFVNLRGGSALVFNNRVVSQGGSGSAMVSIWEERFRFLDWPQWADPQYEDIVHNAYVWNNTYNGNVQLPTTDSYSSGHIVFAASPTANPSANCWTSSPSPLLLPPYPHPLVAADVVDTAAPTIPTGLTTTAISATQIALTWTASTDNAGGSGVAGYKIFRAGVQVGTSATASYTDSGLSASTTYSYTVSAYDNASPANESAKSSPAVSATTQANHAPVAQAQSVSTPIGTPKVITLAATDADAGDTRTYAIVAAPASGSLGAIAGATVTYTPAAVGTTTFTFRATDNHSAVSNTATVTVTVTAGVTTIGNTGEGSTTDTIGDTIPWINANKFTAANAMTVTVIKAKVGAITGSYQCAVYADNAGNPGALLRATAQVTNPAAGWQTFTLSSPLALTSGSAYWLAIWSSAANAVVYCAPTGGTLRWGQYAYSTTWPNPITTTDGINYLYSIYAEAGAVANHAPVATAQSVTTAEDTAKAITLAATDADGNALTYAIVANPSHGTLSGTGTARTYTPAANWNGADSFTFKANDGTVDSNTATVSITVTAVNDVPVATAQSVTTAQNTAKVITLAGTDVEGSALTFATVSPVHGTLTGSGANRTYTPTTGYSGADSFTFTVNDGTATSPAATVAITVTAANTAPVVSAASAVTSPVIGTTTVLSATATDNAGEPALTYAWTATGPAAVTFSAANTNAAKGATATFTKAGAYVLTVTAKDAGNLTATKTVLVTVNATPTRTSLSPTSASVQPLKTVDFNAVVEDQFHAALATQPTLTWAVTGGGTIDANGLFTAGAGTTSPSGGITATTYTVTATGGGVAGTALVTVSTASTASAGSVGGCGGGAAGLLLGLGLMLGLRRLRR